MNFTDDDLDRKIKEPSEPIPEEEYLQFKYRIEEMSKKYPKRNLMLFQLGIATGYRTEDLVCLTIGEIKEALENGYFRIQEQKQYKRWKKKKIRNKNIKLKKPKSRQAEIKNNLKKLLKRYVKNKIKSEYAFKSNKGKYITSKSYSEFLADVGKDLKIEHIGGHSMRKTYAMRLWDATHDLNYVRECLGHKNIETTKLYLGFTKKDREEAAKITDDRL
ncbi:tyrosine-type recombinase/integrase [Clostridium sp. BJN0001]|uniref:tyrosine-type recombinase/integrase n=1 Tax=Clostridium sp. BJN0001 TaxID=2930219 RepID=UPI001FD3C995|nr:tyrosine-type recombinase/integrase [Clostridium sp. BJN0001]